MPQLGLTPEELKRLNTRPDGTQRVTPKRLEILMQQLEQPPAFEIDETDPAPRFQQQLERMQRQSSWRDVLPESPGWDVFAKLLKKTDTLPGSSYDPNRYRRPVAARLQEERELARDKGFTPLGNIEPPFNAIDLVPDKFKAAVEETTIRIVDDLKDNFSGEKLAGYYNLVSNSIELAGPEVYSGDEVMRNRDLKTSLMHELGHRLWHADAIPEHIKEAWATVHTEEVFSKGARSQRMRRFPRLASEIQRYRIPLTLLQL